jgi:hypothetical protein
MDLIPLLARLEALAAENARLRLLTEQAESLQRDDRDARLRLEADLKTPQERLKAVENPRNRRFFRRKISADVA